MSLRGRPSDTEIEQLPDAVDGDHHVLGVDVSMDEPQRRAVGVPELVSMVQRSADVRDRAERDGRRERLRRGVLENPRTGQPFHILHRQVIDAIHLTEAVDVSDVRMSEPCGDPRLVHEHHDEILRLRHVRQDALERHLTFQALDSSLGGEIHLRHTAASDPPDELIVAEETILFGHTSPRECVEHLSTSYHNTLALTGE